MKVSLETVDGGLVAMTELPLLKLLPEAILWGQRYFFQTTLHLNEGQDKNVLIYREGMVWVDPLHTDLTSLTLAGVQDALSNAGYSAPEITETSYIGRGPSGAYIYKIDFFDVNEGTPTTGRVFIKMRDGKPVAEF